MVAKTLSNTNSVVGEHIEPQVNPPMSEITIVDAPELMSNLPNDLIIKIIKMEWRRLDIMLLPTIPMNRIINYIPIVYNTSKIMVDSRKPSGFTMLDYIKTRKTWLSF